MDEPSAAKVNSVHVINCDSFSISTDNTMAMLAFKRPDDSPFALTMPVDILRNLRSVITQALDALAKRSTDGGNANFRIPNTLSVAHTDDFGNVKMPNGSVIALRECVMLGADVGAESESLFLITKKDGLDLAENLRRNILARMSMAERRSYQSKIIKPAKNILG